MTEQPSTAPVELERSGTIATVTLNRPRFLNAVTKELLTDLAEVYEQLSADPDIAVIVLEGAGRAFCAGADVNAPPGLAAPDADRQATLDAPRIGERAVRAIRDARPATLARVHGHAIGGGLLLALANDIRIAEDHTRFRLPEVPSGIPLTWGGTPLLVDELGAATARELIFFGTEITARQATGLGLVHTYVDGTDALDREVADRAAHLAALPRDVVAATKRQFRTLRRSAYPEGELVADAQAYSSLISADWNPRSTTPGPTG